jgi:hypothetical protein
LNVQLSRSDIEACRLCGCNARQIFTKQVLQRHVVGYFLCDNCGSLQTEEPYWLSESYSQNNLAAVDTFAANRAITNLGMVASLRNILGVKGRMLDYGGGDGLLTRLLRDQGIDAFVYDAYANPTYAGGFSGSLDDEPEMVTAFEVLEHLVTPRDFFFALSASTARVFLSTTCLYNNDGPDWFYLEPGTGGHIFFYSPKALQIVAKSSGWSVVLAKRFQLFVRGELSTFQRLALSTLPNAAFRLVTAALLLRGSAGYSTDHQRLIERSRQANEDT